jgi:hypothetical protein
MSERQWSPKVIGARARAKDFGDTVVIFPAKGSPLTIGNGGSLYRVQVK